MLYNSMIILVVIGSIALGVLLGYLLRQRLFKNRQASSEMLSARIIDEAKKEAETIKKEAIIQAKENLLKVKTEFEKDTRERKSELENLEKRSVQKRKILINGSTSYLKKEANFENRENLWSTRNQRSMRSRKNCIG